MSDYFKTLREPLIEQQKKSDEKQDKVIEQLKENQDKIVKALEYDPQRQYLIRVNHCLNLLMKLKKTNLKLQKLKKRMKTKHQVRPQKK